MDLPAEFGIFPNRGGRGGLLDLESKVSAAEKNSKLRGREGGRGKKYQVPNQPWVTKFQSFGGVLNLDFIPPKKNTFLSIMFSIGQWDIKMVASHCQHNFFLSLYVMKLEQWYKWWQNTLEEGIQRLQQQNRHFSKENDNEKSACLCATSHFPHPS